MRWLRRFRRRNDIPVDLPALDVDALIQQVRIDPARYRIVESRLRERRDHLLHRRKALARGARSITPRQIRTSGRLGPQLGSYQVQQDIRNANAAGSTGFDTDLEDQIRAIDDALSTLRAILRGDA